MTAKSEFKAVIFDMDGLLVDSERVWHIAEEEMFTGRGLAYTDEVREQIIGLRLDEFMHKLITMFNLTESADVLMADLIGRMLKRIPTEVEKQPGAQEIVEYVISQDIPTAIASSSPMAIIDAIVTAQGWDMAFPQRFSADDDAKGKPAPDVYIRAVQTLGFEPSECLALEDSPTGSRAAVGAGMTCYAVPDLSHSSPEKFADITPHVFTNLHEVLALLKGE